MKPVEIDLYLCVEIAEPGSERWLALDLISGERSRRLPEPAAAAVAAPGAFVLATSFAAAEALPHGAVGLAPGILWSLLDPLEAGRSADPPTSADEALINLRDEARRFRRRLGWWADRPAEIRERCRRLLAGRTPDLAPLIELLDAAAERPLRPAGSPAASAGDGPASSPPQVSFPRTPEEFYGWFHADDGLGALYGPDFAPRTEQAVMAREVAAALAEDRPLLIEAGTGVGKTLAYLAPLCARIVHDGMRAVVSTHTRALQNQILEHDLPRLAPAFGDHSSTLLMGRTNYLCRRQRDLFLARPCEDVTAALSGCAFLLWLEATNDGLREELVAHPLLAGEVAVLFDAPELCLPGRCFQGDLCHVQRARRRARASDLVVVNHSLLVNDLRGAPNLLRGVDLLVVDEAHHLPGVVLAVHGVTCHRRRLTAIQDLSGPAKGPERLPERADLVAHRLAGHGPAGEAAADGCREFGRALTGAAEAFKEWWTALSGKIESEVGTAAVRPGRVRVRDKDEAFAELRPVTAGLLEAFDRVAMAFAAFAGTAEGLEDLSAGLEDELAQLAQAAALCRQLQEDIAFLVRDDGEDWVTWVRPAARGMAHVLGATRLEAGPLLRECWQETGWAPVTTSATLAVGDDFSHLLGELGLSRQRPPTVTVTCPSPFDYHEQTLVLAPKHFPGPDAPDFGRAVGELLGTLVHAVPRKTLALFTSYRLIGEVGQTLAARVAAIPEGPDRVPVLQQTSAGSSGDLMARFRRSRRALLLGTSTFWEGVDFPGDDLEILVVTKLPFLVPNDPWVEARCERLAAMGENPFSSFMVRDAVLRLRQGVGRLIRRRRDRGVIIMLDNRLHTRNYGVTFLNALPAVPVGFGDTADLIARVRAFFGDPPAGRPIQPRRAR